MSNLFPEIPHPSQKITTELLRDDPVLFDNNMVQIQTTIQTDLAEYLKETQSFFDNLDKDILLVLVTEMGYGLVRPEHIEHVNHLRFRGENIIIRKNDPTINNLINQIRERNTHVN